MIKSQGMKATTFTGILIGIISLIAIITIDINWQLQSMLKTDVIALRTLENSASSSSDNLVRARELESYLKRNKANVDKATSIVAETKTYQYQNQIIEDVTRYASGLGLSILEFTFPEAKTTPAQTSLKSLSAEVTLQQPVDYTKLIQFLQALEQNLTKMQITTINIAVNNDNAALIDSPTIGLEIYVK